MGVLIYGLWLALLGVLAAPSLILSKKPNAKELLDKITPYQGWIGAVSALWGVWGIIQAVLSMGIMKWSLLLWVTMLAGALLQAGLGLLLGVGVLKTFIKNPEAQAKMDQTIAKLAPKQGIMGLIAIGVGVWWILAGFMFTPAVP
jgi:hypothetical protein